MRLYVARHGETTSNVMRALDTAAPGADLTDNGRAQAQDLARRLSGFHLDGIVVSHLVRTQQTAEPTASERGLIPRIDPRVAEVPAGEWEMRTDMETIMSYVRVVMGWMAGDYSQRIPGGETGQEVLDRFTAAIEDADEESLMVVSHGTVSQLWANSIIGGSPAGSLPHLDNCGTGIFERTGGTWRLVEWNHRPTA